MKTTKYIPTIGLEIHTQLKTQSKMFCGCANQSFKIGVEELVPNTNICPVCTAQPGSLPVINKHAVDLVIKAGLALNCTIATHSKFDRKNYFYPDLPKGYQISQFDQPICAQGYLTIHDNKINITRIHLEEDTGKSIHPTGQKYSLVDLNRAGVPLMEMVTQPEIHSGKQAKEFCQALQQILRSLDISDANMEKSQMRCEVNISLSKDNKLGTKVEIKNLNSFKAVERSIEYEIIRQSKLLDNHQEVLHETRGWNEKEQITFAQRSKEQAHDYRYFPEPDLPPLEFNSAYIKKIKSQLSELPQAKLIRFKNEYGFNTIDAQTIINNPELANFTENTMSEIRAWLEDLDKIEIDNDKDWEEYKRKLNKLTANWLINKLVGEMSAKKVTFAQLKVTPDNFAELTTLIFQSRINSNNASQLLRQMIETGGDPSDILEDQGLHLLENVADIEPIVDLVIKNNPQQVEQFKSGKTTLLKFFIGLVMKESQGKANPKIAEDLLIQKLN